MSDPRDLHALLAQVEGATEPDRELDYEVARAVAGPPPAGAIWSADREYYLPLTASIDAIHDLIDRRLNTYSLRLTTDPSGTGADLTWWPNGLSGKTELHFKHITNGSLAMAAVHCLVQAEIARMEMENDDA